MVIFHVCIIFAKVTLKSLNVAQLVISTIDNHVLTESGKLVEKDDKDHKGSEFIYIRDESGSTGAFGLATRDGKFLGVENNRLVNLKPSKPIEKIETEIFCKVSDNKNDTRCNKDVTEDPEKSQKEEEDEDEDTDKDKDNEKGNDNLYESILKFYLIPNDDKTMGLGVLGTNLCLTSDNKNNVSFVECPKPGFGGGNSGWVMFINPNLDTEEELLNGVINKDKFQKIASKNKKRSEKKHKDKNVEKQNPPPLRITSQPAVQPQVQPIPPLAIQYPAQTMKPKEEESSSKNDESSALESEDSSEERIPKRKPKTVIKVIEKKNHKSSKKHKKPEKQLSPPEITITPATNPHFNPQNTNMYPQLNGYPQNYNLPQQNGYPQQPNNSIGFQIQPSAPPAQGEVIQVANPPPQSNFYFQQPNPNVNGQQNNNQNDNDEITRGIAGIMQKTPVMQGIGAISNLFGGRGS